MRLGDARPVMVVPPPASVHGAARIVADRLGAAVEQADVDESPSLALTGGTRRELRVATVGLTELFRVIDLTGVFANAVLGGVIARREKLDPVGFATLGGPVGSGRRSDPRPAPAARHTGGADRLRLPPHRLGRRAP